MWELRSKYHHRWLRALEHMFCLLQFNESQHTFTIVRLSSVGPHLYTCRQTYIPKETQKINFSFRKKKFFCCCLPFAILFYLFSVCFSNILTLNVSMKKMMALTANCQIENHLFFLYFHRTLRLSAISLKYFFSQPNWLPISTVVLESTFSVRICNIHLCNYCLMLLELALKKKFPEQL